MSQLGNEPSLLIVDDDAANAESLQRILVREGFKVSVADSGQAALVMVREQRFPVVITDLMMPGMSGFELMRALQVVHSDAQVIVMTAFGTIETAVEAMREGAYDFVEKPLKRVHIVKSVKKACERHQLLVENRSLKAEIKVLRQNDSQTRAIIGSSPALRNALEVAYQAAPSSANVLILGESGTGKELLARAIHERSNRPGAYVGVNLSALPETILEGELFGYERGAFTGAVQRRDGRIAQAEKGTLFLDEIGELSIAAQVKLLRVLQEGEYEPLGGRTRRSDFRLIAATHQDLTRLIAQGRFREDLYYRLNVISITSPRLLDRQGDVGLLAEHFLAVYARKNNKPVPELTRDALEALTRYAWPGNVRELENVIERAVVLTRGNSIDKENLPESIAQAKPRDAALTFSVGITLDEAERRLITATLDHTHGDKQLAAQILGISSRTIYRKANPDMEER